MLHYFTKWIICCTVYLRYGEEEASVRPQKEPRAEEVWATCEDTTASPQATTPYGPATDLCVYISDGARSYDTPLQAWEVIPLDFRLICELFRRELWADQILHP